ncbi:MAG: hypothetical protein R3250_00050 [Melioribacteraceae bacterium]|nr:hypothetical protein [Melioribacteraceae bacterium]
MSDFWVNIILSIITGGTTIVLILLRIIFLNLKERIDRLEIKIEERLRSLSHEDRSLHTNLHDLSNMLIQAVSEMHKK